MKPEYKALFEPVKLPNGVQLKNRIVMAPMTHFSSNPDGTLTEAELQYIARRSKGVGMVITACVYISPNGKGFAGEPSGDRDDMIPDLRRWASVIQEQGAKAILQLHHGGRTCQPEEVPNGDVVAPSAISAEREATGGVKPRVPRALEEAEIEEIIYSFGEATRRAIKAGFDGIELHGANGYLIQQFFSPHANRRTDRWGGSAEKRLTFPMAVVNKVKEIVTAHAEQPFIVGYRFTPEEPETPGLTMEDALLLTDALANKGLDYIHVLVNDYRSKPRRGIEDNRTRLEIIKEKAGKRVPVIGGGSIFTPEEALETYQTGVEMIALARELIIEPDWVEKVQQGRETEIETTIKKDAQERLVIPEPLWNVIWSAPGWFPGTEK